MTRRHHALEGKVLEVFAKLRHKGKPHFVLVLPDGSRSSFPLLGLISFLLRLVRALVSPWSLSLQTCYGSANVLTASCAGSNRIRALVKTHQTRRANMQRPQLELWSAEPHPTPPVYQELTPQQRSAIIGHLAPLILKMVKELPAHSPTQTLTNNCAV